MATAIKNTVAAGAAATANATANADHCEPEPTLVTLSEIHAALPTLAASSLVFRTPVLSNVGAASSLIADAPNTDVSTKVFFKMEHLQPTGSFKIRGVVNKVRKKVFNDFNC